MISSLFFAGKVILAVAGVIVLVIAIVAGFLLLVKGGLKVIMFCWDSLSLSLSEFSDWIVSKRKKEK